MSEMRLRNRKPLNSYVGQGNQPTNVQISPFQEAKDQDFARNSLQFKKPKVLKTKSPLDQSKKYAQILCQFVQTVNKGRNQNILDYRDHCERFKSINEVIHSEENKKEENASKGGQKVMKDDAFTKKLEVVSKQQQKIAKKELLNKTTLSSKKIKKVQPLLEQNAKSLAPSTLEPKPIQNISIQSNKLPPAPAPTPTHQSMNFDSLKSSSVPSQETNFIPQMTPINSLQQLQQYQQMQQMFQNPIYGMNPAMFSMFPYQMMNYQYYMEQLKQNPYALQGMIGMTPSGMNSNSIPFSKLPFQKSVVQEQKKQQKPEISVQQKKQQISMTKNQLSVLKPDVFGSSGNQSIDFQKKSCYHIAISYNIHFGKMKQKGLFANLNIQENLEKLDPTFPAKKIRQSKATGNAASINDNTSA